MAVIDAYLTLFRTGTLCLASQFRSVAPTKHDVPLDTVLAPRLCPSRVQRQWSL
jgi:hypothetical protein